MIIKLIKNLPKMKSKALMKINRINMKKILVNALLLNKNNTKFNKMFKLTKLILLNQKKIILKK